MIPTNRRGWLLVFGIVLAVIVVHVPIAYTFFYHHLTNVPKAINGNINLSTVNLDEGKIYLNGQYEFYWNQFIVSEPEVLTTSYMLLAVPNEWSHGGINGQSLPSAGYGSYKLVLTNIKHSKPIVLYIPNFGSAYRVYIDGQLTANSGTIAKAVNDIFTVPIADLYPVSVSTGMTHEVVIEVATTRFSGLYMTPVLGDYYQIANENSNRDKMRHVLFGITMFSFFTLLVVYAVAVRRKLYSLWLPVMISFILLRILLTSEFFSVWQPILFFNLSYESTNELMYFTTFVIKYLLIFLIQEQCGITFGKRIKIGFLVYYIVLYLIYFFVPQAIYNQHLSTIVPTLTYVLDVYLFSKIYRDQQTIKKFGLVTFWGVAIIIIGLSIDSYYINGMIYVNMSLTLLASFAVFALIMYWVYAMRSLDLYDDFILSSSRLQLANNQINMQKEYYYTLSEQMNEIREIKHDIRHFIGVMSRLVHENKYNELEMLLCEYGEKTEMGQLPIFCEHIIANSIIGYYYLKAKEKGISFKSHCNIGKESKMSDSDLCIILGNALENAVTACSEVDKIDNKYIIINIGTMKKQRLIMIKNSYTSKLIIKNGRYISSKHGKSDGIGIKNIEKVVESYTGFVKIEHTEREFTFMVSTPEK